MRKVRRYVVRVCETRIYHIIIKIIDTTLNIKKYLRCVRCTLAMVGQWTVVEREKEIWVHYQYMVGLKINCGKNENARKHENSPQGWLKNHLISWIRYSRFRIAHNSFTNNMNCLVLLFFFLFSRKTGIPTWCVCAMWTFSEIEERKRETEHECQFCRNSILLFYFSHVIPSD